MFSDEKHKIKFTWPYHICKKKQFIKKIKLWGIDVFHKVATTF